MNVNELISETVIHEAYFDLWGFSVNWIQAIQNKLLDFSEPSQGDNCEAYTCEACMAVRFQSTDKERVEYAKGLFRRLAALAKPTYSDSETTFYANR